MPTPVLDNFTGTAATNLASHPPDVGPTWQQRSGTCQLDGAGKAQAVGAYAHFSLPPDVRSEDYDVEGVFTSQGAGDNGGSVHARDITYLGNGFDFIQCGYSTGAGGVYLQRWQRGANSFLAGFAATYPAAGVPFTLKLSVIGTTILGFLNGTQVVSAVDPALNRPVGHAAFLLDYTTTAPKIDQFTVSYPDPFPLGVSGAREF